MRKIKLIVTSILLTVITLFGSNYLRADDEATWILDQDNYLYYDHTFYYPIYFSQIETIIESPTSQSIEYETMYDDNWTVTASRIKIITERINYDDRNQYWIYWVSIDEDNNEIGERNIIKSTSISGSSTIRLRTYNMIIEDDDWFINVSDNYFYYDYEFVYPNSVGEIEKNIITPTSTSIEYEKLHNDNWTVTASRIKIITVRESSVRFKLYWVELDLNNNEAGDRILIKETNIPGTSTLRLRAYNLKLNPDDYNTINDLPLTSSNKLGGVKFFVNGKNLTTQISYEGNNYFLLNSFTIETDMKMFDTIEAYYINIGGNPQIIINHSDRPYLRDILEAPENEKPAFVPHTIWDLKTNALNTINDYITHVHVKQNETGILIAYMYIDEYVIENLLTARISWTSRTVDNFLFLPKTYYDWEHHEETIVSGEYITYRTIENQWHDFIPVWNIIRASYELSKVRQIDRIDSLNLTAPQSQYNVTKQELESYFKKTNDNFEEISTNPRYKVWALALDHTPHWQPVKIGNSLIGLTTEFYHDPNNPDDPDNLKIIHLTYITNGKLYEAVGDDMDLRISIDPPLTPTNPPQKINWIKVIVIVLAVFGWVSVLNANKGFKKIENFIKVSLIYIGFLLLVVLIYGFAIAPELASIILRL